MVFHIHTSQIVFLYSETIPLFEYYSSKYWCLFIRDFFIANGLVFLCFSFTGKICFFTGILAVFSEHYYRVPIIMYIIGFEIKSINT